VVIARDRNGHVSDLVDPTLNKSTIHAFLTPIINRDSILCSDGHSWYKTFSSDHGIAHHRPIALDGQRVISGLPGHGQVSDFINDQQVVLGQLAELFLQLSFHFGQFPLFHEI